MWGSHGRLGLAALALVADPALPDVQEVRRIGEKKPRNLGTPIADKRPPHREKSSSLKRMLKNKRRI